MSDPGDEQGPSPEPGSDNPQEPDQKKDEVDEQSEESFPASDPPSY